MYTWKQLCQCRTIYSIRHVATALSRSRFAPGQVTRYNEVIKAFTADAQGVDRNREAYCAARLAQLWLTSLRIIHNTCKVPAHKSPSSERSKWQLQETLGMKQCMQRCSETGLWRHEYRRPIQELTLSIAPTTSLQSVHVNTYYFTAVLDLPDGRKGVSPIRHANS